MLRRAWASLKMPTEMRCDENSCEMNMRARLVHILRHTREHPPQESMRRHPFTVGSRWMPQNDVSLVMINDQPLDRDGGRGSTGI